MNKNIFSALLNAIVEAVTIVVFYPVFITKNANNLSNALKTRPLLARVNVSKNVRSHNQNCIFFSIALAAYIVIAIGNDVEIDMDLAMTALVILFAITLSRSWSLRGPFANC
jgi:hypothetical protein